MEMSTSFPSKKGSFPVLQNARSVIIISVNMAAASIGDNKKKREGDTLCSLLLI